MYFSYFFSFCFFWAFCLMCIKNKKALAALFPLKALATFLVLYEGI
jgi:hypothetical protein